MQSLQYISTCLLCSRQHRSQMFPWHSMQYMDADGILIVPLSLSAKQISHTLFCPEDLEILATSFILSMKMFLCRAVRPTVGIAKSFLQRGHGIWSPGFFVDFDAVS